MAAGNADDEDIVETLTFREIQVLELLAEGSTKRSASASASATKR